ncbi:hypothetical protein EXM65_12665 [Clostridium botulinum]|uniref:Uncharacterized protein n=1 Tax=Clostridium botulinum TaxID=1491 RepID=A0A6M0SQ34_CLOBO|nr:hypothetical protein [Clostridium botulinum]
MDNIVEYKGEKFVQVGYKDGVATFENKRRNKYIAAVQEGEKKLKILAKGSTLKELDKRLEEVED